jgi:multicomponent Na+:H+ antiporter subunit D
MGPLPIDFSPPINILLLGALATPIARALSSRLGKAAAQGCAIVALILSGASLYPLYQATRAGPLSLVPADCEPSLLAACLSIDLTGILVASVAILLGIAAAVYSTRYRESEGSDAEYYALLLLMVAGMVGVGFSGDFLTFFVFWEIMSVASYVLVAFESEAAEPVEAGLKYAIMSAAGNISLLLGIALLYGLTGTLNFAHIAQAFRAEAATAAQDIWPLVTLALFIVGFGTKAAVVPFHTWLPDAHPAAPSPISAMLSGGVIKAGAYGLIRTCSIVFFPLSRTWQPVLLVLALLTMFTGNLLALVQDDLKRLLAFSSIAQIGYIVFGLATGTSDGLTGSLFHILNHALAKGLLFLCAGAFLYATGSRSIHALSGMAKQVPALGGIFTLGMLAIAGLPGLNAFMSEMWIIRAGIEAEQVLPTMLLVLNVLLSVVYYLRTVQVIVIGRPTATVAKARPVPAAMLVPMAALAGLCLVIGLYPDPFIRFASQAAAAVWNNSAYLAAVTTGGTGR